MSFGGGGGGYAVNMPNPNKPTGFRLIGRGIAALTNFQGDVVGVGSAQGNRMTSGEMIQTPPTAQPSVLDTPHTDPTMNGLTMVPSLNYTEAFNSDGSLYSVVPSNSFLSYNTGGDSGRVTENLAAALSSAPQLPASGPNWFLIAGVGALAFFIFKKGRK